MRILVAFFLLLSVLATPASAQQGVSRVTWEDEGARIQYFSIRRTKDGRSVHQESLVVLEAASITVWMSASPDTMRVCPLRGEKSETVEVSNCPLLDRSERIRDYLAEARSILEQKRLETMERPPI